MGLVTLAAIEEAARVVRGRVHRTPLLSSAAIARRLADAGGGRARRLLLKAENLQKTGSFKVRGVLNRIRSLDADERRRGLVTISAGNHAAALAWVAAAEGVPCTVVMPEGAEPAKVYASRGYGAEVVLQGDVGAAFEECFRLRDEWGLTFIHPFDDPAIIAGAGTVGLEIMADAPEADVVVVPVGGGGLVSGVAAAVKARRPDARVYGVEPEGAPGLRRALDAGEVVRLERVETVAGGLAPPFAGALALEHARALVDDVVLVSDTEILDSLRFVLERTKLLVEPSGAAGVAALVAGRIPVADEETVVVVLSGGNTSLSIIGG
ncbi:MAG: pyridoxal-phosphate dependent enzyme [Gemmatimonadetes bacterium]|nr:pyridoxal-phosphate dependent enzyme [Gemmatimonadota bacterium]